jgi:hypothetical protein
MVLNHSSAKRQFMRKAFLLLPTVVTNHFQAFKHKHTNAANTISKGMILLRMFFSLKPKMP